MCCKDVVVCSQVCSGPDRPKDMPYILFLRLQRSLCSCFRNILSSDWYANGTQWKLRSGANKRKRLFNRSHNKITQKIDVILNSRTTGGWSGSHNEKNTSQVICVLRMLTTRMTLCLSLSPISFISSLNVHSRALLIHRLEAFGFACLCVPCLYDKHLDNTCLPPGLTYTHKPTGTHTPPLLRQAPFSPLWPYVHWNPFYFLSPTSASSLSPLILSYLRPSPRQRFKVLVSWMNEWINYLYCQCTSRYSEMWGRSPWCLKESTRNKYKQKN